MSRLLCYLRGRHRDLRVWWWPGESDPGQIYLECRACGWSGGVPLVPPASWWLGVERPPGRPDWLMWRRPDGVPPMLIDPEIMGGPARLNIEPPEFDRPL